MEFRELSMFGGLDKTEVGFKFFRKKVWNWPWKSFLGIILLLAHLLLRNQLWKNCKECGWHFDFLSTILFVIILSTIKKLRIFVTAEPGENSVEMKRVLQDYLRSMRIHSEVCLKPNSYIDVGDGCWRRNVLVTTLRCWWRFWPFLSPATSIFEH